MKFDFEKNICLIFLGFAAIKLTALGRPQLLLQLSEVIARARKYHQEVTGVQGSVIGAHVDPDTFENRKIIYMPLQII